MAEEVTLDVVAKKAGVSRATASRALNQRAGVADDVRDRVRMVADSLNYRPNRAAQNLAGGRTRVVGLVLGSDQLQTDRYATSLVQAIAGAADHFDEGLMLLLGSQEPGRAVQNLLRDGLVDAVVVSAVALAENWVAELLDTDLAKVLIGSHPERATLHSVDVENRDSSAQIVGHLLDSGCRRLGTVTGPLDRVDAQLRLEGFRLAHEKRGLAIDEDLIAVGDFRLPSGYTNGGSLLRSGVDGIFAANDDMARGVIAAINEQGMGCPENVSVAGFDGIAAAEMSAVELTTVVQPFDEVAMTAMRSLVDLLAKKDVPVTQLVEPQIRFGSTTTQPR